MFKSQREWKIWNTRYAHTEAFTFITRNNYRQGSIKNSRYQAHRIIWAMFHGDCGNLDIDHINHDRLDNRLGNLRAVPRAQNAKNKSFSPKNTTGMTGVGWDKKNKKWQARIQTSGRIVHLGRHECFDSAVAARKAAERRLGFHPNHGSEAETTIL